MIICGFLVSSRRACLSFLVRLSDLFCLYLASFNISNLILCRNVSKGPLSVSLSGFGLWLGLGLKGSRDLVCVFLQPFTTFDTSLRFHSLHCGTTVGLHVYIYVQL